MFILIGKVKLGIKQQNVTVLLEDGTDIDDNETFLCLPSGTIFIFVP